MARQEILRRDPPPFLWIVLDECALRPVAEPKIMKAQMVRLLELGEQPNASLRVVPLSAGYHNGLEGSSFKILSVEEGDVAYSEATEGGRLIRSASEVRACSERYHRIGAKALPEDSSRNLIQRVMETMT